MVKNASIDIAVLRKVDPCISQELQSPLIFPVVFRIGKLTLSITTFIELVSSKRCSPNLAVSGFPCQRNFRKD